MVLQRNTDITLWGWANADEEIFIKVLWLNDPLEVTADKNGNWSLKIKTTLSKEAQSIHIKSKESDILLENILFGEVWLCSGQSNMQHPVKGLPGQPTFGSQKAMLNSRNPNLRLFSVGRVGPITPLKDLRAYEPWKEASSNNVAGFSAVGYFFESHSKNC